MEKSKAMMVVRVGGLGRLKPLAADSVMGRRAVVVDRAALKPCWVSDRGKLDWR